MILRICDSARASYYRGFIAVHLNRIIQIVISCNGYHLLQLLHALKCFVTRHFLHSHVIALKLPCVFLIKLQCDFINLLLLLIKDNTFNEVF